jgi:hypothetical protein
MVQRMTIPPTEAAIAITTVTPMLFEEVVTPPDTEASLVVEAVAADTDLVSVTGKPPDTTVVTTEDPSVAAWEVCTAAEAAAAALVELADVAVAIDEEEDAELLEEVEVAEAEELELVLLEEAEEELEEDALLEDKDTDVPEFVVALDALDELAAAELEILAPAAVAVTEGSLPIPSTTFATFATAPRFLIIRFRFS